MTRKLFYEDSYQTHFEAKVIGCEAYEENYAVVLNETAFYPEGGGQPSDQGLLANAKVTYVFVKKDTIYHVVDKPLEVGTRVVGQIDFKRRFDYMQQHTGEHIVSGLVKKLYTYNNVGFHLSQDYMTADFDGEFTKAQLVDLEEHANAIVFNNVPVVATTYAQKELEGIDYRSKLELEGDVRLVTVTGCDRCACCGTHLRRSGEVGLIKILSAERHRGGTRVTLVCGRRALRDYHSKLEAASQISSLLSAKGELIVEAVKRQQEENNGLKQQLAMRTKELFEFKAEVYIKEETKSICVFEQDLTVDEVRRLCMILIEKTERICMVLTSNGEGLKYALGCSNKDIKPLCQELNKAFDGRGGGKEICQGSLRATFEQVKAYIKKLD